MWLTKRGEELLEQIKNNNNLTSEEITTINHYDGFKKLRKQDSGNVGPGPGLIYPLQDILEKYANYRDPLE